MLYFQGFRVNDMTLSSKSECKDKANFPENKGCSEKISAIFSNSSEEFLIVVKKEEIWRKNMKITLRKGKQDDLSAIYTLVYELAVYEKEPEALTATLKDYEQDFESGHFEVLVAEIEEKIVGMALYYSTYSTWKGKMLYLEDFVVQQAYRKMGIGQLLFDAFLEEAKIKEARLVKWQVLDWNEPAINFYNKNKAIIEKNWWTAKLFLGSNV